jgi:hypothetical protein
MKKQSKGQRVSFVAFGNMKIKDSASVIDKKTQE